ncbi:uncharacterized protein (DUF2225 family) [Sphingomonas zeicaulis]|uniref:hypothetical protein n=1 Tax=Sphingomonas zeicaulis TaxID=1632740 RepID=UPI003D238E11
MDDSLATLHIAVSQWFWRMATEAVRIRSNDTYRSEILADVVSEIARVTPEPKCRTALLRKHFEMIPSAGPIEIELRISSDVADIIENVAVLIENQLGMKASNADAISLLLYDFIASRHTTKILEAIDDEPRALN